VTDLAPPSRRAIDDILNQGWGHGFSQGGGQEVWEIDRAFQGLDQLLAPGGCLLQKIDLRDYGLFSANGFHPLGSTPSPSPSTGG